jgi:hypothetical protein
MPSLIFLADPPPPTFQLSWLQIRVYFSYTPLCATCSAHSTRLHFITLILRKVRPLGRPKNRWEDDKINDMRKLKIKNCTSCIQDRNKWKLYVEKDKTFKEWSCNVGNRRRGRIRSGRRRRRRRILRKVHVMKWYRRGRGKAQLISISRAVTLEALRYSAAPLNLLRPICRALVHPFAPCFQTPSISARSSPWQTKFHTRIQLPSSPVHQAAITSGHRL